MSGGGDGAWMRYPAWGGSTTTPNPGSLAGRRLGNYELLSLLGAGGMAEVYLARDLDLLREVAVKVLPATLAIDDGYVARFRDEGRRVAALNHPNIVPVYFFGEEQGLLYLVMPVLRESLRDRMEKIGVMPPSEAISYAQQIAAGLQAAHEQGIVHRDVKPENVLIDADGKALLTDFGIAREVAFLRQTGVARTLAATGLPVGTPEYMAPEQLRASPVDQRVDIYALGVVLYEMLTGTVPFEAATPYEVASLVFTAQVIPPSARNLIVWAELEQVVMRALAKDAAERYSTAAEFQQALDDAFHWRTPVAAGAAASAQFTTLPPLTTHAPLAASGAPVANALTPPPDNAAPAAWGIPQRGSRKSQRKQAIALAAVAAVALIAIIAGSSVAFLHNALLPAGGSSTAPSGGLPTGGSTPPANLVSSASATATAGVVATETAQQAATATATSRPTATPAPTPTATPVPQPTATPVPPRVLEFGDIPTLSPNPYGLCTFTQKVTNTGSATTSWQWMQPTPTTNMGWKVDTSAITWAPPWPGDGRLAARQTDNLQGTFSCNHQTTYHITVHDGNGATYTFNIEVK